MTQGISYLLVYCNSHKVSRLSYRVLILLCSILSMIASFSELFLFISVISISSDVAELMVGALFCSGVCVCVCVCVCMCVCVCVCVCV